jgi:hypothetical protein
MRSWRPELKKLALLMSLLTMSGSFASATETDQAFYYIRLGEYCFTRQFNQQLYDRLVAEGAQPSVANEGAQGDYINHDDFCSKFRAAILVLKQAPPSNK